MKRKRKASVQEGESDAPRADALAPLDLLKMLLNAARVAEAKALVQMHARNVTHQAALAELNALRLEAQTSRNLQTAKENEAGARAALQASAEASRILAEQIGARYAVDWRSASFDPETGAIIKLPEN